MELEWHSIDIYIIFVADVCSKHVFKSTRGHTANIRLYIGKYYLSNISNNFESINRHIRLNDNRPMNIITVSCFLFPYVGSY